MNTSLITKCGIESQETSLLYLEKKAFSEIATGTYRSPEIQKAIDNVEDFNRYVFGWETKPFQKNWNDLADRYNRQAIFAPVEHGKSSQLVLSRTLRKLGQNPNLRGAIISVNIKQSQKHVRQVASHILKNPKLRRVYPHLKRYRGDGEKWTDSEILIQRDSLERDYTLQAVGVEGTIMGTRLDFAIIDDPNGFLNTLTTGQRQKVNEWIVSEVLSRIVKTGEVIIIQTTWHEDDAGHTLAREHNFNLYIDRAIQDNGKPLWEEEWSLERLEEKRKELGEIEFERQMMNRPLSDAMSYFKREWFNDCLRDGQRFKLTSNGYSGQVVIGIDPAISKKKSADKSAFTVVGKKANKYDLLNIVSKRMNGNEILETIIDFNKRYKRPLFVAESNAFQKFLVDLIRGHSNIRIKEFTTGSKKHSGSDSDYGIPAMAIDFESSRWNIPKEEKKAHEWIQGFLTYSPQSHTNDDVMAGWFAWKYLASKGRGPSIKWI
jgi:phage terminase large subunit-like protein